MGDDLCDMWCPISRFIGTMCSPKDGLSKHTIVPIELFDLALNLGHCLSMFDAHKSSWDAEKRKAFIYCETNLAMVLGGVQIPADLQMRSEDNAPLSDYPLLSEYASLFDTAVRMIAPLTQPQRDAFDLLIRHNRMRTMYMAMASKRISDKIDALAAVTTRAAALDAALAAASADASDATGEQ